MENNHLIETVGTACFFCALIHSLSIKWFENLSHRFKDRSFLATLFHFAAEVEIVFGLWAAVFVWFLITQVGFDTSAKWLDEKNFSEAMFVTVIMTMAATRPIIHLAEKSIAFISKLIPLKSDHAQYLATLILGPLLGSLITEPAAMTVSALILKKQLDRSGGLKDNQTLVYSTIATLFVNVSIGGTLTHFAAPPILMVARTWDWDSAFVFTHFGWKSLVAVVISASLALAFNFKRLSSLKPQTSADQSAKSPLWIQFTHIIFMVFAIFSIHHPHLAFGIFMFFLGFTRATDYAQSPLKIKEGLLVGFFLSGLIVMSSEQGWWLSPLIQSMDGFSLFAGATALTAITDNAALTSLAAQVAGLGDPSKFAVVAGAVVGGGLTLIANAPNPAGYSILRDNFEDRVMQPVKLLAYALIPTLIAGVCLWIL